MTIFEISCERKVSNNIHYKINGVIVFLLQQ